MITRRIGKGISGRELAKPIEKGDKVINQKFVYEVADDYTTTGSEDIILADGSSNTVTVTLSAAIAEGQTHVIKALDVSNQVDVDTAGDATIDGGASYTFTTAQDSITIVSDADGDWHITAEFTNV